MTRFAPPTPAASAAALPVAAPWLGGLGLGGLALRLRRWWGPERAHPDPRPTGAAADEVLDQLRQAVDQARCQRQVLVALLIGAPMTPAARDPRRLRIRLRAVLRTGDLVTATAGGGFLVLSGLDPTRWGEAGDTSALRLARRLQAALSHSGAGLGTPTASVAATALSADHDLSAEAVLSTLTTALREAEATGPGTVRLLSTGGPPPGPSRRAPATPTAWRHDRTLDTQRSADHGPRDPAPFAFPPDTPAQIRGADRQTLLAALDGGQFRTHFQPQLSADTGAITGFEALARWHHPDLGLLRPATFMPALAQAGLMIRLGEVVLAQAIDALRIWGRAGYDVPAVAVNVTGAELRDPLFATRLAWTLDRYDLDPARLVLEVLETVAADPARAQIVQNLRAAAALGCRIDLDDFGIGPGALDSLRDFPATRIKIDRSFVSRCDHDADQRRMLAAILSLAERLGLGTVGEGVETAAEHSILSQLGCEHVQGYAIARPMTLRETTLFMERQQRLLAAVPKIVSHKAG